MSAVLQLVSAMLLSLLVVAWLGPAAWMARDAGQRLRGPRTTPLAFAAGVLLPLAAPLAWLLLRPFETLEDRRERELARRQLEELLDPEERCLVCRTTVRPEFVRCPCCETELRGRCGDCSRPVEFTWAACPYCGRRAHDERPLLRLTA